MEGLRTDSPSGDVDPHSIVCSWCAQDRLHALMRFHERILSRARNRSNLAVSCCRRRNFSFTCSRLQYERYAGRGLWLRLMNTCKLFKFSLNPILPTLFTLRDDESKIFAVMFSTCCVWLSPGRAEAMNSVLQQFFVGKEEHGTFRFSGKELRQDDYFGNHVSATAKHGLTRKATADGIHQLRSVTQALAWIARQTRLTFRTAFRRLKAHLKTPVFDTCVSALALSNMQHLHPHTASIFLQLVLGMIRLLRRSVTPVCVKNRNNLTGSLRISNHNKLASQHWHLLTR